MKVRNTTQIANEAPALVLLEMMVDRGPGSPHGIEAQEKRGQLELINSEVLPTEGSNNPAFAAMGVVFREVLQGDPLFRNVSLPAGWSKRATDHDMWSKVVDDKGRERASVFYKAAFYDRRANIRPEPRFRVGSERDAPAWGHTVAEVVEDCGTTVFRVPIADPKNWDEMNAADDKCRAWLDENRPNWRDAAAYWDEP